MNLKDFWTWEVLNRIKGENKKVVCIFLIYKDKILAQTAQKGYDGQFVLPGGKVESKFGEKNIEAVHREMKEETNLNVDVIKKLGRGRNKQYELHFYACVPMDISQMKVMEPNKQAELKFVGLDEKIPWTPTNQLAVDKYKEQIKKMMIALQQNKEYQ